MIKKPFPGDEAALKAGCTCPILDNARGRGVPICDEDGNIHLAFWINADCPIHGPNENGEDLGD